MALSSHFWTVAPNLVGRVRPLRIDDAPWSTIIEREPVREGMRTRENPSMVSLGGALGRRNPTRLALLVHGLGGDADSPYMRDLVAAGHASDWSTLRLSMRGAGTSSPDFHHAGLSCDLEAVLPDPSLAGFETIVVIGASLGGHIALQLARSSSRIAAVVAICAPLDLAPNARVLDSARSLVYRRHIMHGLEAMHTRITGKRERFATIREWDARVVVPRWGFRDVDHYWSTQSVGPHLAELRVPALYVGARGDPMVPAELALPHLAAARAHIDARWVERAGHMGFAPDTDLGMGGRRGAWRQIFAWCERPLGPSRR